MRWLYSLPDLAHDDHVGPGEPVNERTQLYHSVEEQTREPFRHYVSALIQALIFAEPCPDFEAETASALAQRLAQLLSLADVLGRQRALRDLDDGNRLYFAAQQARFTWAVDPPLLTDTPVFLRAPFEEGLTALLNRTPCLAGAQDEIVPTYEATADRVMRGLSEATRHQLRWMLGRSLAQETAFTCEEQVMEFLDQAGFMPRYATVVLRTALIRAHNAGRLRQAEKQGDRAAG